MDETLRPQRERQRLLLFVLAGAAAFLMVVLVLAVFLLGNARQRAADAAMSSAAVDAAEKSPETQNLELTNSVTILLGEDESGHGLTHLEDEKDGRTIIESFDGVLARVARLAGTKTEIYFYFRIDPEFKQQDLRRVRIDVEYLTPQPGSINIHYDALEAPNVRNSAYRDTFSSVRTV